MPWFKHEHHEFVGPAVRTCGNCGQVIPDDHPDMVCARCAGTPAQALTFPEPASGPEEPATVDQPEPATDQPAPPDTEEQPSDQPPVDVAPGPGEPQPA